MSLETAKRLLKHFQDTGNAEAAEAILRKRPELKPKPSPPKVSKKSK